jgi:hypothetical protein
MKYLLSQAVIAAFLGLLGVAILIQEAGQYRPCLSFELFGALLFLLAVWLVFDLRAVLRSQQASS